MNILLTTVVAILIFAILILIHEFGHFAAAKLFGVKVNEFALGMGPKLFGKQKGETLYSVRLVPIGGFCAMEGEDTDCDDPRAFHKQKAYVRLIILAAGAIMNILLGYILLFSLTIGAPTMVVPKVESVTPGSSAETAGLVQHDEIITVNGKRVHIMEDLSWAISNNGNEDRALVMDVENNGERRSVTIVPSEENGQYSYGILLKTEPNGFLSTIRASWYKTYFYSGVIVDSFINMIKGQIPLSQISGPVGIVSEIGAVVEETRTTGWEGFRSLLSLTILLTINLGVFNLFPLPALDGGRIFFLLIEMIRRKPIPVEKEALVHFAGLVLLLIVSVLIAFKDVFMLWN